MTYTDEQIDMYLRARRMPNTPDYRENSRRFLERLANAGITLNFPEPRFYATAIEETRAWLVHKRGVGGWFAKFSAFDRDWNERQAKALAERLNREESA